MEATIDFTAIEPVDVQSTELQDIAEIRGGQAVVKLNRTEAGLAALRADLIGKQYDLTTTKGNDAARADRKRCVDLRSATEKLRKALKAPALEFGRKVDSEAARITAEVESLERPIDAAIKADEARREAERQEKARIEAERIAGLKGQVDALMRGWLDRCAEPDMTASRVGKGIEKFTSLEAPAELAEVADYWAAQQGITMGRMLTIRAELERDEEAARLDAERAEQRRQAEQLAKERAELERQAAALRAEQERIEQERKAAEAARIAAADAAAAEAARQQEAARQEELRRAEAQRSTTPPGEAGGQVDGCRAPESQPDGCSGPVPQDQTSLPASPNVQPGALASASQGGVGENPVQSQPVAHPFTAGDATAECAAGSEVTAMTVEDPAPSVTAPEAAEPQTLTLGQINTRLEPIRVTGEGLCALGFQPSGRQRAAVLYLESDWPRIKAAIVKHINSLS